MKCFTFVFTLVLVSFYTSAQEFALARHRTPHLPLSSSATYGVSPQASPRGLKQRNIGRALTIGGAALGFAGVLVFTDARKGTVIANGQITQEPETGKMLVGIYMIEGGIGMIIPGIILWKRGQKKYNRYLEQQSVSFHSTGNAFALRYSF